MYSEKKFNFACPGNLILKFFFFFFQVSNREMELLEWERLRKKKRDVRNLKIVNM